MNFEIISNDIVRAAITALQLKDQPQFESLLTDDAEMMHNGEKDDIRAWAKEFFFGEGDTRFVTISGVEDEGSTVLANLDSSIAGKIKVKLIFTVTEGKIALLNAGRP